MQYSLCGVIKINNTKIICRSCKAETSEKKAKVAFQRLFGAISFLPLLAMPVLIVMSDTAAGAVASALRICVSTVIPSLFPFLVLASYITASGAADTMGRFFRKPFRILFGINGELVTAFIIGIISGYPAGAMTAAALVQNNKCDADSASRALAFCSNTGPAFLIGGIGAGLLGDRRIGIILYIAEIISAVICGILMRKRNTPHESQSKKQDFSEKSNAGAFVRSVSSAAVSMLNICAFIVFFAVISEFLQLLLTHTVNIPLSVRAIIISAAEITAGVRCASEAGAVSAALISAFAVGWSGFSVLFQTSAVTDGCGISLRYYIPGKIFQSAICPLITFILMQITGII